ncbi:MAG: BamA/TamA family outer membrane protein [Bacteroidota bacterium]
MWRFIITLIITVSIVGSSLTATAQEANPAPIHSVILIGNTARLQPEDSMIFQLQERTQGWPQPTSFIVLGDIVDKNGWGNKNSAKDSLRLNRLATLTGSGSNKQIYFLPGDRDWANSGQNGWKKVKDLEKHIEKVLGIEKSFLPSNGCPGPKYVDLPGNLRIIAINTPWWMHPYEKPQPADASCKIATPEDFYEELESLIDDAGNKNVLVVGHHPVFSTGQYAGKALAAKHIFPFRDYNPSFVFPLPVLGSFYAAYRQNIGTIRDMANPHYQAYVNHMALILSDRRPLVYASGHEYNLQAHRIEGNIHLNSGSFAEKRPLGNSPETLFRKSNKGYMVLHYYEDGGVGVQAWGPEDSAMFEERVFDGFCGANSGSSHINTRYVPCEEAITPAANNSNRPYSGKSFRTTGGDYPAGPMKKLFLGQHWRDSWNKPVKIPYLDLDTTFGGLTPFAVGGGRQTTSLKLKSGNGQEYVFRSVDKNPYKALGQTFRNTLVQDIVKDQTTTQHPYGALVVDELLNRTDVLHAHPKLYVLPPNDQLGMFKDKYGKLFGMLEDRPKKPKGDVPGFEGADDVLRSVKLFRKMYKSPEAMVDQENFAKARVFDILIGDWGRHQDNWKWAGYKDGKLTVYKPIPRDRDHAFSRWDGFLPWLADREWAKTNAANFGHSIKGVKSLTWPARHLDRFVANELSREDWEKATNELLEEVTDEAIDMAIQRLPKEIIPISGNDIREKLKARRAGLAEAVSDYYALLAKKVDVRGTNEDEVFEVERLAEGNLLVRIYVKVSEKGEKGRLIYERTFVLEETKEVCLWGLGGEDVFSVTGQADKGILLRIISGPDEDIITDVSQVKKGGKSILIYDNDFEDQVAKGKESKLLHPKKPVHYEFDDFAYNTYLPVPSLSYSPDNGFGAGLGVRWTVQGFRKPGYASKHSFQLSGTTVGNLNARVKSRFRQVLGPVDAGFEFAFAGPDRQFTHFYGLGENSVKNDSAFQADFYRIQLNRLTAVPFLAIPFWRKSEVMLRAGFEAVEVTAFDDDDSNILFTQDFDGEGSRQFAQAGGALHLDFRDHPTFARKGAELYVSHTSYYDVESSENADLAGVTEGYIAWYTSIRLGVPFTLALKAGGADSYNDLPFYYLPQMGRNNGLRGYFRNRFVGSSTAYANGELRIELGRVMKSFLPTKMGLLGFADAGRVWLDRETPAEDLISYGGGLFFAPLSDDLTLTLTAAFSDEESLLIQFGFGFYVQ